MSVLRATTAQLRTGMRELEEQANVSEMGLLEGGGLASDVAFVGALRSAAAFLEREINRRERR